MPQIGSLLAVIAAEMLTIKNRGKVADYIPELSKVDPSGFAMTVVTNDNQVHSVGDCDQLFSIQSVSKVLTLTLALGKRGDAIWNHVGREPSGSAFNSIVLLEHEHGIPRNPFINAGAIAITDLVTAGHEPRETIGEILRFIQFLASDDSILIDDAVAKSELATGHRNFALAHFMKSHGNLIGNVDKTLGVYFHQCAIAMSCTQLAKAGRFLAHGGKHPETGRQVISAERTRRINALMLTCGHYDGSGDFAFRVGLPAKSGVGGGILAIVPGVASVAVWSPGLNEYGNSLLGTLALQKLADAMGWSVFNPQTFHAANLQN
jgi:glutaminase